MFDLSQGSNPKNTPGEPVIRFVLPSVAGAAEEQVIYSKLQLRPQKISGGPET